MYPACTLFCHFLPLILWDFAAQFGYTLLKLTHLFFMFHLLEYLSHELSHKVISLRPERCVGFHWDPVWKRTRHLDQ